MKKIIFAVLAAVIIGGGTVFFLKRHNTKYDYLKSNSTKYDYDIEVAFPDEKLIMILDGQIEPVKVEYNSYGETTYEYSSEDKEMINGFIEALKELRIKKVTTDPDKMFFVSDAVNDFRFTLEDGSQTGVSLDLKAYANVDGTQYYFENNEKLIEMCDKIRSAESSKDSN